MLELSTSILFFYLFSCLLFFLAKKIGTARYSFGFFVANLLKLRDILPGATQGFFNFLFIFFSLFLFFVQNFISSGIKTDKVIVDDSLLVDSQDKILASKMNACFFEESHLDIHKLFPKNSVPDQVYQKQWRYTDHCYIMKAKNSEALKGKLFFFPSLFFFVTRFLVSYVRQDMFLSFKKPLVSSNLAFYLSKGINSKLRSIIDDYYVVPMFEQGHLKKLFELCEIEFINEFPIKNTIFISVQDYNEAYTLVNDLQYSEFKAFFYLHLLLLSLFSAIQVTVLSRKFALKIFRFRPISF